MTRWWAVKTVEMEVVYWKVSWKSRLMKLLQLSLIAFDAPVEENGVEVEMWLELEVPLSEYEPCSRNPAVEQERMLILKGQQQLARISLTLKLFLKFHQHCTWLDVC